MSRVPRPSKLATNWLSRPATQAVLAALTAQGHEARAVGGAVRDTLLRRPVREVDLATDAPPEIVIALAERAGLKALPTGVEHGTVTVVSEGAPFQVTTLRQDVETDGRHARVAFTDDWTEDARRRDFTMNALYAAADGTLFDPLDGFDDLMACRVRFIGDAAKRIEEDHLRILRLFRFQAELGREPLDGDEIEAAVRARAGLRSLSAERVREELMRLLVGPGAGDAIEAMFLAGLLVDVIGTAPRLGDFARLIEIEAAQGLEPSDVLRLAALALWTEDDAARLAERFRLSRKERHVLEAAARPLPEVGAAEVKAALYRDGVETFGIRALIGWARSSAPPDDAAWRDRVTTPERWTPPAFPVRADMLIARGHRRGPDLGALLKRMEAEWIASGFTLDRDSLIARC